METAAGSVSLHFRPRGMCLLFSLCFVIARLFVSFCLTRCACRLVSLSSDLEKETTRKRCLHDVLQLVLASSALAVSPGCMCTGKALADHNTLKLVHGLMEAAAAACVPCCIRIRDAINTAMGGEWDEMLCPCAC